MSRRVVVTGVKGRLGAALVRRYTERGWQVMALDRSTMDLRDENKLRSVLSGLDFELLFNPAAMTSLEGCLDRPEEATLVNGQAPGWMAECCRELGARMIHFSTDYVFSGREPGERREEEACEPVNHYGASKLAGERAVLSVDPRNYVARVSWLFGPDGHCFVDEILGRASRGDALEAVADKWSAPTYMDDLVDWLDALLKLPEGGVVQLCNAEAASWHDYACEIVKLSCHSELPVTARKLAEMSFFRAERPVHTKMATERLTKLTGLRPRLWRAALAEFLDHSKFRRLK